MFYGGVVKYGGRSKGMPLLVYAEASLVPEGPATQRYSIE